MTTTTDMTAEEREIGKSFCRITFLPGSYDKRFCRLVEWMAGSIGGRDLLTEKQHRLIYTMLHRYRRQIPDIHEKYCPECNRYYLLRYIRYRRSNLLRPGK